jgi:hypothetical protein
MMRSSAMVSSQLIFVVDPVLTSRVTCWWRPSRLTALSPRSGVWRSVVTLSRSVPICVIRPSVACASSSSRRRKNSMVNCITQIYGSGLFDSLFIQSSRIPIAAAVGPGDDLHEVAVRIFEIETAPTIVVIYLVPLGLCGVAPISKRPLADPTEDIVEL